MFDYQDDYPQWREFKLSQAMVSSSLEALPVKNPYSLTDEEIEALNRSCEINNFALYRMQESDLSSKSAIGAFSKQLNMQTLDKNLCADNDSITSLQVMNLGRAKGYIPYTSHALNWHTDGYYNRLQEHIRSFLLHCVQPAASGGENMLINHELIYILLNDKDPGLISALSQNDALTIPANIENGIEVRPQQSGPVFYRDELTNTLQMRYTARTKSIQWKQDKMVLKAVNIIEELLTDNKFILHYTLQPGEGFICNNILHGRSAFTNGSIPQQQRLMYRARSYNRLFS